MTTFIQGQIHVETVRFCGSDGGQGAGQSAVVTLPTVGSQACAGAALVAHLPAASFCQSQQPDEIPAITVGLVSLAFQNLPLPASRLHVQPPGGRTLVNFETNFFTQRDAFTRHVNLLGRHVTLRIRPAGFIWAFGDGTTARTTTPGAPYPDLDVTHSYFTAEPMSPRVDTTYSADWRLDGGPWRPVPGRVTITGAPVGLDVIEARPTLVAHE